MSDIGTTKGRTATATRGGPIEASRAWMADPGNPHLISPGQVFRVPDPPSPPRR